MTLLEKYNYQTDIIAALYSMYKHGAFCATLAAQMSTSGEINTQEDLDVFFNKNFLDKAANLPMLTHEEDFNFFHEFTKQIKELK